MNSDGSGARPLTVVPGSSTQGEWSPDGRQVLVEALGYTRSEIWLVPLDGGDLAVLADEGYNFLGRWFR